ncbi:MAG: WecB/TagA/CpsF family glycosyltransferase [Thermomicrobiales bacterium]|nr:WecB/TagA/CpsF family glycosyltransferase [Thermomicrobiales bacterium]
MSANLEPSVLGVRITPGTHTELLTSLSDHLCHAQNMWHMATANPEYVMFARRDPAFAAALGEAAIVTVDGVGLALAMRLLHPNVAIERYTGVTLTTDLAELSADSGAGIFLLGAGPGIATQAAVKLAEHAPGVVISGVWDGGTPQPIHDAESIDRIVASGARIVLVAYGAPAQIHWIQRNLAALDQSGVLIVAGIGGAFDYLSGNTPWAPAIVRRFGLEWLYRLVREPWRWRRQLVLPQFVLLTMLEFARTKLRGNVE